ncbi:MAG TPA: macro domain-containing protein [Anaerohalosphaeraceae bacterium]|nr:macro domain-containing protein [Anaerohalosphaeraceae bacterium]HQG06947.1 macro domain-containing protein [Anaerohalosphaeraceae bacterium]HQI08527.1 macro domain-containing protein [Anaerohalosphaeraceae bacterium]HQJ68741.1 macro domain-containing protein [Anaerohalosphaeraceae bacterium]
MSINVLIGNIFDTKAQTLVNTVNCVGIMGKGIAQEFKKRFPAMFKDYQERCGRKEVQLGRPYLYRDLYGVSIVNFPTKAHWRSVSRLEDICNGLTYFLEKYKEWGITSIAFPPLGCGNGGLEWDAVGPLIYQKLSPIEIPVEIYAPYGTPKQKLTLPFLNEKIGAPESMPYGSSGQKIKPEWIVLLEIVRTLQKQPYARPVGRIIFQKICYTATEMGLDTGFFYKQGAYGPFSSQIKPTLTILANNNLVIETQVGQMTALRIGPEYETIREQYIQTIRKYQKIIEKVSDLFMRIKSTEQAEEVSTVLYSIRRLKQETQKDRISEREIYDFILKWKKNWDTSQKKYAVASAIRNLGMLQWIKTDYSENLPIESVLSQTGSISS